MRKNERCRAKGTVDECSRMRRKEGDRGRSEWTKRLCWRREESYSWANTVERRTSFRRRGMRGFADASPRW